MMDLKTLRIRLQGEYRDLWLYKGYLYCWSRDGKQSYVELKRVLNHISTMHGPAIAAAAQVLLFRNDWKVGEQFRSMMLAPEMQSAFLAPFRERSELAIEIPLGLLVESNSEPYSGIVLDTTIYADHLFFATTEGLLQSFVNSDDPEAGFELSAHTDQRASQVTVRYSAINVSAEENGLYFGRLDPRGTETRKFFRSDFRKVAPLSRQSSYANHDLLNYGSAAAPELLKAQVIERETPSQHQEKYQIVGYAEPEPLDSLAFYAATADKKVSSRGISSLEDDLGDFEVLGNSNNQMLATWNDRLRVISMNIERDVEGETREEDVQARPSRSYRDVLWAKIKPSDILQSRPINGGFVVETLRSVQLITKNGLFTIGEEPVAQLRTFANSVRHKEVVATVEEHSASLVGYYAAEDTLF